MKRFIAILAISLLCPTALFAQQAPSPAPGAATRQLRSVVIRTEHRDPNLLASAVQLLGSGLGSAAISVNEELRTITVRDFPENIAAIQEAVARLDQPLATQPDLELRISVLIGSRTPLDGASVPETLEGVVKQLRATLAYGHYGLMTTTFHRTPGGAVEGTGVAESALLGNIATPGQPMAYRYTLSGVSGSSESVAIKEFTFSMRVPLRTSEGGTHYQDVGFRTPVTLRPGERVVIGTTTMGEKALIVVLAATVSGAPQR